MFAVLFFADKGHWQAGRESSGKKNITGKSCIKSSPYSYVFLSLLMKYLLKLKVNWQPGCRSRYRIRNTEPKSSFVGYKARRLQMPALCLFQLYPEKLFQKKKKNTKEELKKVNKKYMCVRFSQPMFWAFTVLNKWLYCQMLMGFDDL